MPGCEATRPQRTAKTVEAQSAFLVRAEAHCAGGQELNSKPEPPALRWRDECRENIADPSEWVALLSSVPFGGFVSYFEICRWGTYPIIQRLHYGSCGTHLDRGRISGQ